MPKFLRILLTGSSFAGFFLFGCVIGRIALPILAHWPGTPEQKRLRVQRAVCNIYRAFVRALDILRLIDLRWPELPPDFPRGRGYVLISNHPTLIDTLILMGLSPGLSSVIKPSWWNSPLLAPLMRHANHIPGPDRTPALPGQESRDSSPEAADDEPAVVTRMVAHLRAGFPLVIFPEGSRSFERKMRRFRRGAIEAAIRAGVPIVPAFISVNPPMLMKHQPWYEVPGRRGCYRVEFFPVIETAGKNLDARRLNRDLRAMYEVRFAQLLRERDAGALAPARAELAGSASAPDSTPSA